ncbi:hypothetical protein [Lignipirellula cremea]|nr:hypothetical protein [Lignipirellula cremea]
MIRLTDTLLSFDYDYQDSGWTVKATSFDGCEYEGKFFVPGKGSDYEYEICFSRFDRPGRFSPAESSVSSSDKVFLGVWVDDAGSEKTWLLTVQGTQE